MLLSIKRLDMSFEEANILTVAELMELFEIYVEENKPKANRATQADIDKMFS